MPSIYAALCVVHSCWSSCIACSNRSHLSFLVPDLLYDPAAHGIDSPSVLASSRGCPSRDSSRSRNATRFGNRAHLTFRLDVLVRLDRDVGGTTAVIQANATTRAWLIRFRGCASWLIPPFSDLALTGLIIVTNALGTVFCTYSTYKTPHRRRRQLFESTVHLILRISLWLIW